MLDKDRGTYSPPTEDNLSYETRRQPSRDQVPMTLIISGICLIVLLLAVVIFYNSGLNKHGGVAQEVGDPLSSDYKDGKVTEAKPLSDKDLTLDNGGNATFAPGTEAPVQRAAPASQAAPVAVAPTTSVAPAPVAPIAGPLPSQSGDVPLAAKPAVAPVLKPPLSATSASSAATKPVASSNVPVPGTPVAAIKTPVLPNVAAVPKPVVSTPAAAGSVSVQIGAFASPEIASKQYANVTSSYGLFLSSSTGKRVEKVETDKGTFYRTSVTGFASAEKAKAFCSALKSAGHDCFVK